MFPAAFDYLRPATVEDALLALAEHGPDAKVLAGGQSLIPILRFRLARPALLVDIDRLAGLDHLVALDELRIGALVREAQLATSLHLSPEWAALREAAAVIADPLVRNRGTIGGNVAHADPANDLPAVMVALGARAVLRSAEGHREVAMGDFFRGPMETALRDGELLVELVVPAAPRAGSGYVKIERQAGDYAIVGAAAWLARDGDVVSAARIALTNAGLTPQRCPSAERRMTGAELDARAVEEVAELAAEEAEFWDDLRGTVAFKRAVARRAVAQAITRAMSRAGGRAG